ncbi:MAG: hypothetical protein JRJ38_03540 [Deltaproteobacteria bacterium]|nr:hypothetical protein [Deltaproteobacteria bacterium]
MEVRQVVLQMSRVVQRLKYLSSGLRSSGFSAGGQEVRDIHLVIVISVFWLDFSLENRTICLNLASLSSLLGVGPTGQRPQLVEWLISLPATRLPTPGTADSFNAGVVALAGRLPCACPPLPINKVHLPAIAICAVIAVARRPRRWQAGATHELPGGWQAGAGIQAVYCDRRWQAGRVAQTGIIRFYPWPIPILQGLIATSLLPRYFKNDNVLQVKSRPWPRPGC